MNLYREKGVNPASGCMPMLLTMPVLFAFYALLSQAIELRGASFGWWIKDLSQPDPFYVIPILVVADDVLAAEDDAVTGRSDAAEDDDVHADHVRLHLPDDGAGTVLYWFVSNLWAIGQQYFTNWLIGPPVVHAARPAGGATAQERRRRTHCRRREALITTCLR